MPNTYLDFIDGVKAYYGSGSDQWVEIAKYGLRADNAIEILSQVPGVDIIKNSNGSIRNVVYKEFTSASNAGGIVDDIINGTNSNIAGGTANVNNAFNMQVPANTTLNTGTNTIEMVSEIGKKTTGQKVIGILGNIGQAVMAVGAACTLGKTLDKIFYNINPDFWDAHDMETLNPDTWAEITNSGSVGDNIFNLLMGVDPETNETTPYVDQNALAYMAFYLQSKDFFESTVVTEVPKEDIESNFPGLSQYIVGSLSPSLASEGYTTVYFRNEYYSSVCRNEPPAYIYQWSYPGVSTPETSINTVYGSMFKSGGQVSVRGLPPWDIDVNLVDSPKSSYNKDGLYYYEGWNVSGGGNGTLTARTFNQIKTTVNPFATKINNVQLSVLLMWLMANKTITTNKGKYEGVGNQDGGVLPDLSNATSVDDTLRILKETYPELFENAVINQVPQPDGTIKEYVYVPITLPNTSNSNDPQPETGGQTQGKPQVNPELSPQAILDLISKLIGEKLDTPNPPDTGKGDTPPVVIPTGSASALYKIYNPSQSELDSFGTWLWSTDFVDQLLKIFNNPMESIIGLHKVFAPPVVGGQTTIKVGYLDSKVPSNYISNQYTKIDCGTINLQEYFGNVFDYTPYTTIELYLPCVGFVKLDVGNVMRSSINIVYTVDVLTGACLAEVNVKRDGSGGTLYSYSGNCATQYPLSMGSYMGIVSSVIGIAGSIVGTIASGGSMAPLALGAASGLFNAKTSVQHSGSLTGNSGVMGGKIPYLIISRPQTNMPDNYQHLQGIPSNVYVTLSSCNGYVKVKNVNVSGINAESEELNEIKSLLLDGVII